MPHSDACGNAMPRAVVHVALAEIGAGDAIRSGVGDEARKLAPVIADGLGRVVRLFVEQELSESHFPIGGWYTGHVLCPFSDPLATRLAVAINGCEKGED